MQSLELCWAACHDGDRSSHQDEHGAKAAKLLRGSVKKVDGNQQGPVSSVQQNRDRTAATTTLALKQSWWWWWSKGFVLCVLEEEGGLFACLLGSLGCSLGCCVLVLFPFSG